MNKTPKLLKIVLLLLVAAGIGAWAWKTFKPAPAGKPDSAAAQAAPGEESGHVVVVTYFTSDQRCPTCLKIEKQTREAVEGGFPAELATGELRFQTLNMDRPENKHYVGDYGMTFKTVVITELQDGKQTTWEKFDEVWDLVQDPQAFSAYIREGIQRHLKNMGEEKSEGEAKAKPKANSESKSEPKTVSDPFSDA